MGFLDATALRGGNTWAMKSRKTATIDTSARSQETPPLMATSSVTDVAEIASIERLVRA